VRRLLIVPALIALVAPTLAGARPGAVGDGALILKDASGRIVLQAKGGVIGRFDEGALIVRDPNPDDELEAVVTGAEQRKALDDFVTVYTGKNIRFRFIGGRFKITLRTSGMDLSATGKGIVTLQGAGTLDDGTYSFNGEKPKPLPLASTDFTLSALTTQ
jgi:hypothetical protein